MNSAGWPAIVRPATICRLDDATIERVRSGGGFRPLVLGCVIVIVAGASTYGATMGLWRGPLQATYGAVKLVGLFGALLALTTLTNVIMAGLLRARLSASQVAMCSLLGLAVTATVLGALAPVSLFFTLHAPPLSADASSFVVAQRLLGAHVVVFAVAGTLGVRRTWGLLRALVDRPDVARRVLWVWLLVEGLVGAELSWVLRPFVGKPNLPITALRSDAFDSSFFDEVARITTAVLGPAGPWIALAFAAFGVLIVATSLRSSTTVRFAIERAALLLTPTDGTRPIAVPWGEIRFVRRWGGYVEVGRFDAETLRTDTFCLPCADEASARRSYEAIEHARAGPRGPFRTAPVG